MARKGRIQSPTGYYHVMMRGNNREDIFLKEGQKRYFRNCIKEQNGEGLIDIAAYCIMDNHTHIVTKSESLIDLSAALKNLNGKYAVAYNYRHDRVGHVFQGRFKSETIADDAYLLNVVRYVHNNPVKAGAVKEPGDYEWSSYNEYLGRNLLIGDEQKYFILQCYRSPRQFIEFHEGADSHEYLDLEEDIKEQREKVAQAILSRHLKGWNLSGLAKLKNDPVCLEKLIKTLLVKSKLSHRQIARLLGISNNMVHTISTREKQNQGIKG